MDIEILSDGVEFDLYGLSGDVENHDYAGTGQRLMAEMGKRINEAGLLKNGMYWVYDTAKHMFTGVKVDDANAADKILEHKLVKLEKYAYCKHVGPYEKLGDIHRGIEQELAARNLEECGPRVEKYGSWSDNSSKLVTEVLVGLC